MGNDYMTRRRRSDTARCGVIYSELLNYGIAIRTLLPDNERPEEQQA